MQDLFDLNSRIGGSSEQQEDPLRQAVKSYKEAMRSPKQDLDVKFFKKTLEAVNGSSPLKVARNPIDEEGRWRHGAELRNVRGFGLDESGRLTVFLRGDKGELSAEKALDQLMEFKRRLNDEGPVMLALSESKQVQITDVYSHAFVQSMWAGLPFDLVLAYFDEKRGDV